MEPHTCPVCGLETQVRDLASQPADHDPAECAELRDEAQRLEPERLLWEVV